MICLGDTLGQVLGLFLAIANCMFWAIKTLKKTNENLDLGVGLAFVFDDFIGFCNFVSAVVASTLTCLHNRLKLLS